MDYTQADVVRAENANVNTLEHALDFLQSNPQPLSLDAPQDWPPLSENHTIDYQPIPTSDTFGPAPAVPDNTYRQSGGISNARNSLDKIDVTRVHSNTTPMVSAEGMQGQSYDDELQRVMELSRKEQDAKDMERDARDLKHAIQLSKQQTTAVPVGDQELMRVLEESLKDNPNFGPDRTVSWQSHSFANAKGSLRKNLSDPVGLRNIGNTCYLNSLLQVYYHLPEFRRAIMSFRAPPVEIEVQVEQPQDPPERKSESAPEPAASDTVAPTEPPTKNTFDASREGSTSDKSDNKSEAIGDQSHKKNAVEFVVGLQRLFAAMALGNQTCVDPTPVTQAMRDAEGKPISIGAQQDASEFNNLFLDMVERGLSQHVSRTESSNFGAGRPETDDEPAPVRDTDNNVVKSLFTIKFQQEIRKSSRGGTVSEVDKGALLSSSGDETSAIIVSATTTQERNLHGGLEDYTVSNIEYREKDSALEIANAGDRDADGKSGILGECPMQTDTPTPMIVCDPDSSGLPSDDAAIKTVWFTKLPPVVVIYVQRGRYNRETLQAEKIYDRYDFPISIAFDRYHIENKAAAIRAREEVRSIRNERKYLISMLDQYRLFPVSDQDASGPIHGDCDMTGNYMQACTAHSDEKTRSRTHEEEFFSAGARMQKRLKEALDLSSPLYAVEGLARANIEASIGTIQAVLDHDRKECDHYQRQLQGLKPEAEVYKELNNVKYALHAVLVHDGAPDGGHYWTFIRDWGSTEHSSEWMRLSDSMVTFVSVEEMMTVSAGGNGRASAYCLIYTAASACPQQNMNVSEESRKLLPPERLEEVAKASAEFEKELESKEKTVQNS